MPIYRRITDPETLYFDRVSGKRVVYLDTNAWSDLSEAKTETASTTRALAITAHERGLAVFPLSYPSITELLKRQDNSDSRQQVALMDVLSSGVTLRGARHVQDLEVLRAYSFVTGHEFADPIAAMFTIIPCYIADTRVMFPDGWTDQEADKFMQQLSESSVPGLQFLQQWMRTTAFLEMHTVTDEKYVREISRKRDDALVWAANASGKPNSNMLREEEHRFVASRYIVSNLPRLVGLAETELFLRNVDDFAGNQARSLLKSVVERMPSTWLSCEMNVQRTLATSVSTEKQDFYDHEHAALAVPYTNAFVTSDGALLDLLRKTRAADRYPCKFLRGTAGLQSYLETLLSETNA